MGLLGLAVGRTQERSSPQNQASTLEINPDSLKFKSNDEKDALILKLQVSIAVCKRANVRPFVRALPLVLIIATEACWRVHQYLQKDLLDSQRGQQVLVCVRICYPLRVVLPYCSATLSLLPFL